MFLEIFILIQIGNAETWIMNGIYESENGQIESQHPYQFSQRNLWKIIAPKEGEK